VVSEDIPQDKDGLWRIDHQRYEPKLSTGARLQFSLRVNPVITRVNKQGRRHDVVMDLKKRCGYADLTQFDRPLLAELVQEAGVKWLVQRAKKLGFSFSPDEVRVDGYRQHTLFSRGRKIRFSTLDFNGVLQIAEPDIFIQKALFQGLGSAKAFGCGLMLVKRI
jgi:CRISPR system Cascade subunit CasE